MTDQYLTTQLLNNSTSPFTPAFLADCDAMHSAELIPLRLIFVATARSHQPRFLHPWLRLTNMPIPSASHKRFLRNAPGLFCFAASFLQLSLLPPKHAIFRMSILDLSSWLKSCRRCFKSSIIESRVCSIRQLLNFSTSQLL